MWRALAWVCTFAVLASAAQVWPRCADPQRCALLDRNGQTREFEVEGKKITIQFGEYLQLDCNGWAALDSKKLPIFTSALLVPKITLRSCPPPAAADGSFLSALSALNVTLQRSDTESILTLEELPQHPALQALAHCDELQQLVLSSPAVAALPDRWVARCPHLEYLSITHANNLVSLTSKPLENATALRNLSLTDGVLETLPAGLLDDMPNLVFLNLSSNRLQMLPSGLFKRVGALRTLQLSHNELSTAAVAELAGLLSLEELDLSSNSRLSDLCDNSAVTAGYSQLLQLKKLTKLKLASTNITHICRDWRENMTSLLILDLANTKISELRFSDLQYIREESIFYNAWVNMRDTPVVSIRFTEEEYNASLVGPRSGAEAVLDWAPRLRCDCGMYWARRALFPADTWHTWGSGSPTIRITGLKCSSGLSLGNVPADKMKCAA